MLFQKQEPLHILHDQRSSSAGKTMYAGRFTRGTFLYYGQPLTQYHIAVRRGRRTLRTVEFGLAFLFAVVCFGLFVWQVVEKALFDQLFTAPFWIGNTSLIPALFWLGAMGLLFVMYRTMRKERELDDIEVLSWDAQEQPDAGEDMPLGQQQTWEMAQKLPKKKKIDISLRYTIAARETLERAYLLADKQHHAAMGTVHVLHALLSDQRVGSVFMRLGVPVDVLQKKILELVDAPAADTGTGVAEEAFQIIFHAYEHARQAHQDYVHVTELLLAAVQQSPEIQELLYAINIDAQKLINVIEWVRIRERLRMQYSQVRRAAMGRNKYGLDRAMTAVSTPFLNQFSKDLTMAAVYGHLAPCVAREKEIDEIFRVVDSGRSGVLLVGDYGVGKMSLIQGMVQRMIEERVPEVMKEKRLVMLSTSALLAGTTVSGAQERLLHIANEMQKARNVMLFIKNIDDLMGSGAEGFDVSEALAELVQGGRVFVFATTTEEGYQQKVLNSPIGSSMTKIDVGEMNENQAIQVLQANVGSVEYKHNVFFSYDAIAACVQLAARFLHDERLPQSAIELMRESAAHVRGTKGEHQLVTAEDIGTVVGDKTGVPVTSITEGEGEKLLRLEEEMHKRVVGQSEAVTLVANALRRARADIRSTNRPIANFLFLGSTGVGKTELAKTIADVYFGGEDRMIRVDMSEYQDSSGIYRLIGQPGKQGTGLLTEAVRQNPFSLVLLDEMEKADPKILDLFLQVFDDGRLTDSVGRVIDFTNTIMIATSNAGTSFVQEGIRSGKALAEIREQLIRGELKQYFRPEFLNRFDGLVVFKPLTRDEIKKIASYMLRRVAKDLETRGVELRVEEAGLEALAQVGFDPEFGARPMRRAIQEQVENPLAELLLKGELQRNSTVLFDGTVHKA